MSEEGPQATDRVQAEAVCPVCGHPLGTIVKRYKTLGTFVPRWIPAPCGNPDCGKHAAAGTPPAQAGREGVARGPAGAHRADTAR